MVRCFDISHHEASISAAIFELIYSVRNAGLIDPLQKYTRMKEWFFKNKVYSYIIDVMGRLGIKIGKNPSGCFNTLTDNTEAVIIILIYYLCRKYDDPEVVMKEYFKLVVKILGDDTILDDDPIWDELIQVALELGFEFKYEHEPGTHISKATFLNFGFAYDSTHNMHIFKPNFDKLFANLFFNMKSNSWRLCLAKLFALRIMCYPFPRYRFELENYIDFVRTQKDVQLRSEKQLDKKLSYYQLQTMYLHEREIQTLIYGFENNSDTTLIELVVKFLFYELDFVEDVD